MKTMHIIVLILVCISVLLFPGCRQGGLTHEDSVQNEDYFVNENDATESLDDERPALLGTYKVTRVVDGDTIKVGNERIRLIGIDTPESKHSDESKNVPMGETAYVYLRDLIEGKEVELFLDVQERDKYGRILAYVYLADETKTFINEQLVLNGYARVMTVPPNVMYEDVFVKGQEYAKENGLGIWEDYESAFPE